MPQRYLYTVYEEKEIPSTSTTCKKRRNWTRYWRRIVGRTWWLNVWKRKKKLILSRDFRFRFQQIMNVHFRFVSAVNGISFSSAFLFTAENEKYFSVGLYSIHHEKVLVLRCKVLVLVLKLRSWWGVDHGLGKSLDYITKVKQTTKMQSHVSCNTKLKAMIVAFKS